MTLTTVGYGDLSPSTFPGKLIGNIIHGQRIFKFDTFLSFINIPINYGIFNNLYHYYNKFLN